MKIPLYTQEGEHKGEVAVSEKIFGQKVNTTLVHRMLLLQLANKRHAIAHAKTKGEVRGGGKKPYKQKHTGRARQGSTRNPHFRGGGVVFGPRNTRNFTLSASHGERRKALFGALSEKFCDGQLSALEGYEAKEAKTKTFATMIKKLPFKKQVLFVIPEKSDLIARSSRNIPKIKTVVVNYLNIVDLMKYEDVVFFQEALPKLEEIFAKNID